MKNIKTFENFNKKNIFQYIFDNDIQSVKNYIDSGYDLNILTYSNETTLIYAASSSKIEIVKLLLNTGIDVDKQDNYGNTALLYAAVNNNREIIKLLLDYGADEFILDGRNRSFYDHLSDENKQYFLQNYPTSVYKAIYHDYKKSFTEFVKDYNIKK